MYYANAQYFPAVVVTMALLVLFYLFVSKRRRILMERFAQRSLLDEIASSVSGNKRIIKRLMLITAFAGMFLAVVRPQWGFEWEEIKRSGLDIVMAIDVSKSMLARDVKPNRLERSKFAVKDLVKRLNGDRIGLIAFAGTAFLQCPPTIDYDGFMLALDDLGSDTIPRPGTSISSAIREAIKDLGGAEKKFKVLIIITDGEELEGDAIAAASDAAKNGIKIYCVGVGTAEGELIPTIDESGQRVYLADRGGTVVKTRLNEELLKKIALSTGGSYVRATQAEFGLTLLYDRGISKLEKIELDSKMKKAYQERFQIFLLIAFVMLILEPFVSDRRRRTIS